MKLRQIALVIIMSIVCLHVHGQGLQTQLENVFDDMVNVTPPGVFQTQKRGVITGGRFTHKNKIFNENLAFIRPPSYKASCGGVDMFGGSFSFVNSDQIVQLLRAVGANAKSFAFQLALDQIAPGPMKWMNVAQEKIQSLNKHFGNSCQLAQGLVTDVKNGFKRSADNEASLMGTFRGFGDDFFSLSEEMSGSTSAREVRDNSANDWERMTGNIIYKLLRQNNASAWFAGGDDALYEAIISITGSIVISDLLVPDQINAGETNMIAILPGNLITLQHLVDGVIDQPLYNCAADRNNCIIFAATKAPRTLRGFKTLINDEFQGANGIIAKFRPPANVAFTQRQENLMANLPNSAGALIRNLALLTPDGAEDFVNSVSDSLALLMAKSLIDETLRSAKVVMTSSNHAYSKMAIKQIEDAETSIEKEYTTLLDTYGSLSEQMGKYNDIIINVRKARYMISEMSFNPAPTL